MALTKISTGGVKDDAVTNPKVASNAAIQLSKLEVIASNKIVGNDSGNAVPKELTPAEVRTILNINDGANDYTHPNHSGEVTSTGDGATVIASNVVDEDNLKVSNTPTNGQFLSAQSGNTGGLTWADVTIPPSGNTFTAVANGAIANNKAVKLDSDGKVSEIKATTTQRSTPDDIGAGYGIEFKHDGSNNNMVTQGCCNVWDPDNEKLVIIYKHNNNNYVYAQVASPTVSGGVYTGAWTFGDDVTVFNTRGIKNNITAFYDTTKNKVVCFFTEDTSNKYLYANVGTVSSSSNTISFAGNVHYTNGDGKAWENLTSAWDSTTGRGIVVGHNTNIGTSNHRTSAYAIGYINGSNSWTWHTTVTSGDNFISKDVLGNSHYAKIEEHDVISIGNSKWLYVFKLSHSGETSVAASYLYSTIINAPSSDSAPTYAHSGYDTVANFNTFSNPKLAWDPVNERAGLVTRQHDGGEKPLILTGKPNTGYTDFTWSSAVNLHNGSVDADFNIGFNNTIDKFVTITSHSNQCRARFVTLTGTDSNTPTVSNEGIIYPADVDSIGDSRRHDPLIEIGNGDMILFLRYVPGNDTRLVHVSTTEQSSTLTDANHYVGYADQAYTNGQTATIKTYGNTVDTLSGLTIATEYYVQGDGTVATTKDNDMFSAMASNTPLAGISLSATKLLIRDPLAKT
jgi:hypothetical protein